MRANKQVFAVGVDAGALSTRCLILQINQGVLRYAGHGEVESAGWTKGRLADPAAMQACMRPPTRKSRPEM